jgi:hypothetical protein
LAVRLDSSEILYAGTGGGTISKSVDGGFSWRMVIGGGSHEVPKIVIDPVNPMIAYATSFEGEVSERGVWKTTNGGEEWLLTALADTSLWGMDIDVTNPQTVYAGLFTGLGVLGRGVFRTTDGGDSWTGMTDGLPEKFDAWSIKVHPMDPTVLWLAGGHDPLTGERGGLYRWVESIAAVQGVVLEEESGDTVKNGFVMLESTGETVLLDTSGGVFTLNYYPGDSALATAIHIESFPYYLEETAVEFQIGTTQEVTLLVDRLPLSAISGQILDSLSFSPLNAEITLTATTAAGERTYSVLTNPDGSYLIDSLPISHPPVVSYGQLQISPVLPHSQLVFPSVFLDSTGLTLDALIDTADVLITSSLGSGDYSEYYERSLLSLGLGFHHWDQEAAGNTPISRLRELRKKILIYFTGDDVAPMPADQLDSLDHALDLGIPVFLTGQDFVESNGSSEFISQRIGLIHAGNTTAFLSRGVAGDLLDGLVLNMSGGDGADNQASRDILQISNTNPVSIIGYGVTGNSGTAAVRLDDAVGGSRLILFGFGFEAISAEQTAETVMRQIIGYLDGSITVSVSEIRGDLPTALALDQNYPNPFNPTTKIRFHLPAAHLQEGPAGISKARQTTLEIYDLLGRSIATLVDEKMDPGHYEVRWDAAGMPTGVYLYRLQAGSFTQTRKLMLLR